MKMVMAIFKPFKLDDVRDALTSLGIQGLTVSDVRTSARMVRGIWWVSRSIQHQAGTRKGPPRIGAYLASWGMSLVEDVMRATDSTSSEEIILFATKTSPANSRP